jgi:branched-subunit amino acid ABC-type transport system permease component
MRSVLPMTEYLQFIIFGLVTGSVYAISAMGLVLTYKISGLFNFGHGAVCAAGAFVFYSAHQDADLPWPVAAFIAIGVFGVLAGLLLERISLALSAVHISYKIVGTVGILVGVRGLAGLIYGENARTFEPFISQKEVFSINGVIVGYDQLLNLVLAIGAAIALYVFFRTTRLGTAMRGVVDDPQLLDMAGTSPAKVRRSAWIIGNIFASTSGVLFAAAQQQLDVNVLSLLVVQAFGAAAIARFSSLPMCLAGGLAVGVLQKLVSKEVAAHPAWQGLDLNMPFIVLFIALLVIPRRQLVEVGRQVKSRAVPPSPFSARTRASGYAVVLGGALLVPQLVGSRLPVWTTAMSQVVLFASLALLVKTSGQISLCHIGFAAIGATGFGHMLGHGVPWGLAVLLGGLWAVPAGALIAIPAIRLSGLYLGLATLGFGVLLAQYAYIRPWMFGDGQLDVHRPSGADSNEKYYYLLLAIAVAAILLVGIVERSRLGRLLRGMADSPVALTTLGTNVNIARVLVFCLSTFLAGISGATYASLFSAVNQDSFNYVQSLIALAVMAIAGRRTVTIAIVAPILLYVIPGYLEDPKAVLALQLGFGVAAIFAAATSQGAIGRLADKESAVNADRVDDPVFGSSSRARELDEPPRWRIAPDKPLAVRRDRGRERVGV